MKYLGIVAVLLLCFNCVTVYAVYEPPTKEETSLFNSLLDQFEKLTIPKKNVQDAVYTFQKPFIDSFQCNKTDSNDFIVSVVTTKLAKFDKTIEHHDVVTGGVYTWDCLTTRQDGKITIQCNNELRLNPDLLLNSTATDPRIKQIENLMILYHELLHGQLMIDAIKSSATWRKETCNLPPNGIIDYSFADPYHKVINPLQEQFASELTDNYGGKLITKEIPPQETENGTFLINVLDVRDYPQFTTGAQVNLRGSNIANTKFFSSGDVVSLGGNLVNKTENGEAWFYVFNKLQSEEQPGSIPADAKRTIGLWSVGKVGNHDFSVVIQELADQHIITATNLGDLNKIPSWVKKTAYWWFDDEIDDKTFVNILEYLSSSGLIS